MSYERTPECREKTRRALTGGRTYAENFWRHALDPDPETGCAVWAGALMRSNDYGQATAKSPNGERYAHRVAWELSFGTVPKGRCVLHTCDVPPCVTPSHLFLGVQADNVADMMSKGRNGYGDATGRRCCAETRAKISAARRGWNPSAETRRKMSLGQRRRRAR